MKGICTYYLIQQTPMIHFQSRELGACLRASEVKPKLDKFICQNVPNIPKSWYIDQEQSSALNYKLKIFTEEKAKIDEPDRNIYFGNTGQGPKKETVMYKKSIEIKIVCFNDSLMEIIKEHLEAFFLLHNFGTRQNKGFGSFVLKATVNRRDTDKFLSNYINSSCNIYKISYNNGITYKDIFADIGLFSAILKSGYNQRGYIKSYLVKHCLDKNKHNGKVIGGDKRWLKSSETNMAPIIAKKPQNLKVTGSVDTYRYNRALLGSAGNLQFINRLDSTGRMDRDAGKTTISINGSGEVKRIPSPVLYKIVGNTLYIIVREHSQVIYGEKFKFSMKKERYIARELPVPYKEEVDIQLVIRDYIQELNDSDSDYYKQLSKLGKLNFLIQGKSIIELRGEK